MSVIEDRNTYYYYYEKYPCYMTLYDFIFFISYNTMIVLPIYEIYIGICYNSEESCHKYILPLNDWLFVKSTLDLSFLIFLHIMLLPTNKYIIYYFLDIVLILFQIFNFLMVVLGTIVVLRDCTGIESDFIKVSLYIILILEYLLVVLNMHYKFYIKEKEKRKITPILSI